MNGDGISDLLIGAYRHNSGNRGRSLCSVWWKKYQVILSLSDLNGINGFKLEGEAVI